MSKIYLLFVLFFLFIKCDSNPGIIESILNKDISEIRKVMINKKKHEIQILLSQVKRDKSGNISFIEDSYQLDENKYFYPASTAKLPIAILALQKIKSLRDQGIPINADTPFLIKNKNGETIIDKDSTNINGDVTINHLIKKIFLVSDNDAYNYLFDFLGRDYINNELIKRGLKKTQIHHKFLLGADNVNTWEYTFIDENQNKIFHQSSMSSKYTLEPHKLNGVLKGKGYISSGKLINEPMKFDKKNRISIRDLQGILKRIIFPEEFNKKERFELEDTDYKFLRYWMSRTTLESNYPNYKDQEYWDSYCKFFIYGDKKGAMTPEIRIYNKVGFAYGTLTDVAYIKDNNTGLDFFLTATVLVNENQIFNDNNYEFEELGIPFLASLGREILIELNK